MIEGFVIPKVTFRTRVFDNTKMENRWQDVTTDDYLKGKRVVLFSLPGAFTPTCSTYQLPGFEENYDAIRNQDIDEVYCISVNDAFVMNAWGKDQKIQNVKMIPDGSGNFTRYMGMLIGKNHLGFGMRSWRYMAIINDMYHKSKLISLKRSQPKINPKKILPLSPKYILAVGLLK